MAALTKAELDAEAAAWREQRRQAGFPVDERASVDAHAATKSLPSAGLSIRDTALIKGLAPAIHEYVKQEIERAIAPLKTELAVLKALAESRPPAAERERGHENDASRGPTLSDWRQ
jgi:hypothetical protein